MKLRAHTRSGAGQTLVTQRRTALRDDAPVARHVCRASEAPDLVEAPALGTSGRSAQPSGGGGGGGGRPKLTVKGVIRGVEKRLANLQLAIWELAVLAGLSAVGTVIDQEQTLQWYMENYPDGPRKVLGFLDYNLLFFLQLDHIYTSTYFLGISALLAASLVACSKSQQYPLLKVARRWQFPKRQSQVFSKGNGETLPQADVRDLGQLLRNNDYEVFLKDGALYAFKGIAGRFAPIAVHVSLLAILFGAAYGAIAGFEGQVMVPVGSEFLVANVLRSADTALPGLPLPAGASKVIRLDKFDIDYRSDGSVGQYRSVLSERDLNGREEQQKEIYVNEPMRFGGITIYQTDWALSAIRFRLGGTADAVGLPVEAPLAEVGSALGMNSSGKVFGTFIPLELPDGTTTPRGLSILARDLQQVVFYDAQGQFVGVRRPGSNKPIVVEGQSFVVDELVGSSGMQLKHDPGVWYVYAGFGFLMITTIVSYISHSQVWALQDGADVHVSGRTNRALVTFKGELSRILDAVPEAAPHTSAPVQPDGGT